MSSKKSRPNRRPRLNPKSIEPMILMSASLVESATPEDADFSSMVPEQDASSADYEENGYNGALGFFGGDALMVDGTPITDDGSIRVIEGQENDFVDLGGITEPATVDLTTNEVSYDGETHQTGDVSGAWGLGIGETFKFSNPEAGGEYVVVGDSGAETIDLSQFVREDVEIANGAIRGPAGDGEFTIYYADVDYVEFSDATETLPGGPFTWPEHIANDVKDAMEFEIDEVGEPVFDDVETVKPITGTELRDVLKATGDDDVVFSLGGNDHIETYDGNDVIDAGSGNDWIQAGAGADTIDGGEGKDRIAHWDSTAGVKVNLQNQTVSGGSAEGDKITSIEEAVGSNHDDVIIGSEGNNGWLRGGDGDDLIEGLGGNDRIIGDAGDDVIKGGSGKDHIRAGIGDDVVDGGTGKDWIQAGAGADVIDGGEGNDRIAHWDSAAGVNVNLHNQTVSGGSAEGDKISSIEEAVGSNHDDVIIGSDGNNKWLRGGAGDDVIEGRGGDDLMIGDAGNDLMDGGEGNDVVRFRGKQAEFEVTRSGDDLLVKNIASGDVDTVRNVESFRFNDGTIDTAEFFSSPISVDGNTELQATGGSTTPLNLNISSGVFDSTDTVSIEGVPAEAVLTSGVEVEEGVWEIPVDQLGDLGVRTAVNFSGDIDLIVDSVTAQRGVQSTELSISVSPAEDPSNFIANGSFEDLSGLQKVGFGHIGDQLNGWDLEDGPRFEVHNPRGGVDQAADGEFWLDMDASPGNVTVSQAVLGLEEGKVYDLSFDTANSNPFVHRGELLDTATNGVEVFWNSEKVAEVLKEDAEFTTSNVTVRSGSGDGSDRLTFRGLGNEDNVGISLDNIRMTESDNLLINGSFENTIGMTEAGFGHFGDTMQGWEIKDDSGAGDRFEAHKPRGGVEASDGDLWMDMGGSPGNLTMSQQVPGLVAGESYVLGFDLADSSHDSTDGLKVVWNGEEIAQIDGQDNTMDRFEFQVEAGTGNGEDRLTFEGTGNANNFGVSLDDVTLVEGKLDLIHFESQVAEVKIENKLGTEDRGSGHNAKQLQGLTLEENATLVAQETFEGGATGWSDNTTTDSGNSELTEFLGRFGGSDGEQIVSKEFDLPEGSNYAVVEFDFLKLDSWDANRARFGIEESLNIFVNDSELTSFTPEGNLDKGQQQLGKDGVNSQLGNTKLTITSAGEDTGMNGRNDSSSHWQERVYRVRMEVANPGDSLKLGFGSTLDQGLNDESFGIDNVTVYAAENPGTSIDEDGNFSASQSAASGQRAASSTPAKELSSEERLAAIARADQERQSRIRSYYENA